MVIACFLSFSLFFVTACEKDSNLVAESSQASLDDATSLLKPSSDELFNCNPFEDIGVIADEWQQVHRGYFPMQFNASGLEGTNDLEPRLVQYVPILQTQGSTAFMDAIQQSTGLNDNRREMLEDLLTRLATTQSNPSAVESTINGFISDYCKTELPQEDKKAVYAIAESIGGTLGHEAQFYGETSLTSGAELSARSMFVPCWLDVVLFTAGGAILGGVFGVVITPPPPAPPVPVPAGPTGALTGAALGLYFGLNYIQSKDCNNDPGPDCSAVTSISLLPGYTCSGGTLGLLGGVDLTNYVWANAPFISPQNATTLEPRLAVSISDINLPISSIVNTTCVDESVVNENSPVSTISLADLSSDITMQFYSYTADANDFSASHGQVYDFYITSSRPNPATHTVTYTTNAPWVFTISQDPNSWYSANGTAAGYGTAAVTATITDNCTGATASQTIQVTVQ